MIKIGTVFLNEQGQDVVIEHNTLIHDGPQGTLLSAGGVPAGNGFVFRDNLATHADYGIFGNAVGSGNVAIDAFFVGSIFANNGIIDRAVDRTGDADKSGSYPASFLWANSLDQAGFTDYAQRDFRLLESSPFKNAATDGKDLGVDWDTIMSATECARSGQCSLDKIAPATPLNLRMR